MTIKTILIPLAGYDSDSTVLNAALVLAQRFHAHLQGLHVCTPAKDNTPFVFDRLTARLKQQVLQEFDNDIKEKAEQVKAFFEQFCKQNRLPLDAQSKQSDSTSASWHEEVGRISEVLVRRGRAADLIVLARPEISSASLRRSPAGENLEAMLLETGRLIFVVPPQYQLQSIEHITIGWNASLEASRAVAMALPCLRSADSVTLLTSEQKKDSAQEQIDYLTRHGINATTKILSLKQQPVDQALLTESKTLGAGLLVIGGFSHARSRQLLFGGVTRNLLAKSPIPILMVH